MKKSIFLGLAIMIGVIANAQLTDAVLYHKNGQLGKAKTAIDKASKNEKMIKKSKVWYYDGLIYMDLAKKQEDATVKHNHFDRANNSLQKAIDINIGETWVNQAKGKIDELCAAILIDARPFHNSGDYENSLKLHKLAGNIKTKVKENQINGRINAAIAASQLPSVTVEERISLNEGILELSPNDIETYVDIIILYDTKGDSETALEYAEKGSEKFPDDKRFTNEIARLAIKSGKGEEAIVKLKAAAEKDPDNTLYYNKIADLYSQQKDIVNAEKYYKKALEIDANSLDANYNIGSLYFNKGAEIQNEINQMDLKEYQKSGDAKEKEAKAYFEQCIPHYEIAYSKLDDAGKEGLKPALLKAYMKVGRDEDADNL